MHALQSDYLFYNNKVRDKLSGINFTILSWNKKKCNFRVFRVDSTDIRLLLLIPINQKSSLCEIKAMLFNPFLNLYLLLK